MSAPTKRIVGIIERHLGPDASDELYAKCMTSICEGYSPDCSYHHTCMHDGDCFRPDYNLQAARLIDGLARKENNPGIKQYLTKASAAIRDGTIKVGTDPLQFPY